jgi:hypothetical protein
MGPYLSQPNKTKESYDGSYTNLVWAASAMQGSFIFFNKNKKVGEMPWRTLTYMPQT